MRGRWRRRPGIGVNVTFGMRVDLRGAAISGVGLVVAMTRLGNVGVMADTLWGMLFRVRLVCVLCFSFSPHFAVGFGAVIIGGASEMHWRGGVIVTLCSPGSMVGGTSVIGCSGVGTNGCSWVSSRGSIHW